jgi:cobalamin synthase
MAAAIVLPVFVFLGGWILGFVAVALVFASVPVAFGMEKVSNAVFGGVSGDMIGATNEVTRAVTLVLFAVLFTVVV